MCDDQNQTSLKSLADPSLLYSLAQEVDSLGLTSKSQVDQNVEQLDSPGYNVCHYPPEPNEVMSYSMFDDNGNPMDEQDFKDESEVEDEKQLNYAQMHQQQAEEATFFINAAAVSDEEDGAVYMAGSRSGDIIGLGPTTTTAEEDETRKPAAAEQSQVDDESSILFKRINHRSRVPISRSYPDIIQTTMTEKLYGLHNPTSSREPVKESLKAVKTELVLADSLEELTNAVSHNQSKRPEDNTHTNGQEHTAKKLEPRFSLDGSTNLMNSSMAGISGEKPPDSWTIDFNSLSVDETLSECEPKSSNSNSLAYFLDINEATPVTDAEAAKHIDDDPKKIFSLFIDIGDKKEQQNAQQRSAMNTSYYVEKKMPNAASHKTNLSGKNRSSGEKDYMGMSTMSNRSSLHVATHDLEDTMFSSSILSSMEASGTDEDMDSCLKLGMDLLRMFQEGINTDVQISVNGRVIRAHRCILASRSQYFAAVLSGSIKAGNAINLDDYSYSVVQFTLYHIYSGTNEIPDSIDLVELTSLTDLLGLEGLKEIISNTIKAKFAHNFHRPCSTCIIGVIQFFPIAISYGMEDLSRKMTKWMSKHFVRIWPTKAFASLGDDLIEKCLSYTINHLSGENLLDIMLGCDQLLNTMPNIKWAETIFNIVTQLTQACVEFIGQGFCEVLQSQRFLQFGKGQAWNISRIENTFLQGLQVLKPDDACLSHVCLTRLIELGTETFDEAFVDFLIMLQREVEKYLLANTSRAVLSKNWERLSEATRKKICSTGFLGYDKSGNKVQPAKTAAVKKPSRTETKSSRPTSSSTSNRQQAAPTSWKASQRLAESQIIDSPRAKPRQILSPTEKGAKVASVRPMPSQPVQHQNVFSSRQTSKANAQAQESRPRAKSPGTSRLTSKPLTQYKSGQLIDTSPASSSSSKPVTPVTPSRPKSFPFRNTKLSPRLDEKPTTPTKPVFLTNSEKSKAVSKPTLKMRSARSNSLSSNNPNANPPSASAAASASHSRQSSVGSMVAASTATAQPRTPNLSQPSRYATSLAGVRRNPVDKITQSVSAMPKSPAPKARVNSANAARRTAGTANSSRTTPSTSRQISAEDKKTKNVGRASINKPTRKPVLDFDSGSDSDTLMTKSNIEDTAPNTEPKIRTLADIGRSNTFSKDEPTVIGKMDFGLDVEYTQL